MNTSPSGRNVFRSWRTRTASRQSESERAPVNQRPKTDETQFIKTSQTVFTLR